MQQEGCTPGQLGMPAGVASGMVPAAMLLQALPGRPATAGLALVIPNVQSLTADYYPSSARGKVRRMAALRVGRGVL